MKRRSSLVNICFIILMIFSSIQGCKEEEDDSGKDTIVYQYVNKEFVVIMNVDSLLQSDDEISNHIDSILHGLINSEVISTGQKDFNLDADPASDIGFEIIDLNKFNPQGLPENFDSLAARVIPLAVEILDNSTYGYCDALDSGYVISENANWTNGSCVLGTFMNAGQFQGRGEKYLGIRLTGDQKYRYGWIRLYCSQHNDTLRIIEYAYNDHVNGLIYAGQKE